MLTRVLLVHMFWSAVVVLALAALVGGLLGGLEVAGAVLLGGALVAGSGAGQIWLVGQIMDPAQGTPQKAMAGLMLVFKLVVVGAALWWILSTLQPDGLGLVGGMCAGLASLVFGLNRGSMSQEGQAAMNAAEEEIARAEAARNEAEEDDAPGPG